MKRSFVEKFKTSALATAIAGACLGASGVAQAADVSAYSVQKGQVFTQTSAAAPTPLAFTPLIFRVEVQGDVAAITDVFVQTPSVFAPQLELTPSADGSRLEFVLPSDSLNNLNLLAPSGRYTFLISTENDGDDNIAFLDLDSSVFPATVPQISNFIAAQAVDAAADFTLNFNPQGANESYVLTISEGGAEVFTTTGTGTSAVIPGGTLSPDVSYNAALRYVRPLQVDTASYPGATGTAALFNETQFDIETGLGGGGGDDTDPPVLVLTTPANGAVNVAPGGSVSFTFSEVMAATQAIEWSANVNASALTYAWINGGTTLRVTSPSGFPTNATVIWRLNPTAGNAANFRDVAGNVLLTGLFQGSFTTSAGGPVDPCDDPGQDDGRGFGNFYKSVQYVQTNNAPPVLDVEMPANLGASYRGASNQNVTAVSISGPGGNLPMPNLFGFFLANRDFATPAALDAAFPAGNYTITATGAGAATLAISDTGAIPTPRITNVEALRTMDVTQAFTLTFAPFTGAAATDSIFISISEQEGQGEFHAPDPCRNILLPNTATSIVIPANTFRVGRKYNGSISFSRNSFDTNSIPNSGVSAGVTKTTSFEFTQGGGGTPTKPMWTSIARNQDGTLTYTLLGDTGVNLAIEASDSPDTGWAQLTTAILATGSHQFTVDPRTANKRFFRARVL